MCSNIFNHALHMERANEQTAFVEEIVCWDINESLA